MNTNLIIHDRILWVREGSYERSATTAEIVAVVGRLVAQVTALKQEIEQACADFCGMCRDFPEAVATRFDDTNWQHWAGTPNWKHCGASTIRERAYQREQSK